MHSLCKKVDWGIRYRTDEFRREWFAFANLFYYHGHNIEVGEMVLAGFEALKSDHPDIQHTLGVLHYKRGQLEEAEKMWKQALAGYEKAFPDHPGIFDFDVVQNLGKVYDSVRRGRENVKSGTGR